MRAADKQTLPGYKEGIMSMSIETTPAQCELCGRIESADVSLNLVDNRADCYCADCCQGGIAGFESMRRHSYLRFDYTLPRYYHICEPGDGCQIDVYERNAI